MQELEQRVDAALAPEIQPDGPGAAIAIVRDGEVILRKGDGFANVEMSIPMPPDAVFPIASLTKQFTAVAIMMLKWRRHSGRRSTTTGPGRRTSSSSFLLVRTTGCR